MSDLEENAVVQYTEIGWGRCGLQLCIYLKLASGGQGFIVMAGPQGVNLGSAVCEILKALQVQTWEKLVGHPVRIKRERGESIDAIGHYLENRWFHHKTWWDARQVDDKHRIAELEAQLREQDDVAALMDGDEEDDEQAGD